MTTTMFAALAASIASVGLASPVAAFQAPASGITGASGGTGGCGQLVQAFVKAEHAEGRGRLAARSITLFIHRVCGQ